MYGADTTFLRADTEQSIGEPSVCTCAIRGDRTVTSDLLETMSTPSSLPLQWDVSPSICDTNTVTREDSIGENETKIGMREGPSPSETYISIPC